MKKKESISVNSKNLFNLPAGTYSVSENLYLRVRSGSRSYIFRYMQNGVRKDMSLGTVQRISLPDVKRKVLQLRATLAVGNSIEKPKQQENVGCDKDILFKDFAVQTIVTISEISCWKNKKHQSQWLNTVTTYAIPVV